MKKGLESWQSAESAYVEEMCTKLREARKNDPPRPVNTKQFASTLAAVEIQKTRKPEEDKYWANRPLPENWKAVPDADFSTPEGIDRAVNKRNVDPHDVILHEATRHSARNTLGQSELSATTPERRESAIHHFEVSGSIKASDIDQDANIVGMVEIISQPPPKEVWIDLPWHKALWHWLKGNKTKSVQDDRNVLPPRIAPE